MQKEKLKQNRKSVGVAPLGDPHFKEITKNRKGITLVALVITIIVMLILVGVTISVSLKGGLFSTAKQATNETQIAQEKEELLMAALGALNQNGKVELSKLDSNLPEGFTGSNGEYTSKNGNIFTVTEDGTITLEGEDNNEETNQNKISFTVEGITYYAEEGTKWGDWLENSATFSYTVSSDGFINNGSLFWPLVLSRFLQCNP